MDTKSYTQPPVLPVRAEVVETLPTIAREAYVLGEEIARGGMGRVVQAHDRRLGRDVAIKELLPDDRDRRVL